MKSPSHRSLLVGFALAIALIGGVTWLNMDREKRSQDAADWVAHTHEVRYVIADLFSDLQDVESGMRGFVLTGMPVFLETYHAAARQIEDEIRLVRKLTSSIPEQQENVAALEPLIKRRLELAAQFVKARQEQGFEAAQSLVASRQGLAAMEAVRAEVRKMDAVEVLLLKERDAMNQKEEADIRTWTFVGAGGSLLLLALVFALLLHENRKRQAAEGTLRESESLLLCVLNSIDAHIAVVDRDGTIIATNEAWAAFARANGGDPRTAGVGANYLAACERGGWNSEEEARQVLEGLRDALASSCKTFACEYACHSPTEQRWFAMHAYPLSRAAGGAVIAHTNITARWRAHEIEGRLAAIVKSSGDAIISKDLNGIITSWNGGAEKLFGYTADEVVGTSILRLIPPGRQQEEQEILKMIRSGRSVDHFETLRQDKDGRLLDVSVAASPIKDANGAVIGASKVARDITGKKQAENMIAKLSADLETIFNSVPSMIWFKDDKNNFLRVNQAAAETMGRPVAEIEGKSAYDLLPDEAEHYYEDDREVLASGKPKLKIIEGLPSASGETKWVQTDKVPYRDKAGNVIGLIVISVDITERIQAQEELSQKNAEIEIFTNAVSHDLKSPLVTIKTFLGYLEKDLADPAARAKDLGYIHGAADKMKRLLDDLLALACIGQIGNAPVDVPLQELVQEARLLVAGQIAERGVQVEVTGEPVWLHGDRARLVQIFQNLVDNAVKFMGDQPAPRIEIGAEQEGGETVLFVRDNGKGIDPRDQQKLFVLFERIDPHAPGSGIGLATVRRIVEAHGGKIHAQSDGLGKGTTFRFTLAKTQVGHPQS